MSSHPIGIAPMALSNLVEQRTRELSLDDISTCMSPMDRHILDGDVDLLVTGITHRAVTSGNRVALYATLRIAPKSGIDPSRDVPVLISWTHHRALRTGEHPEDVILDLDRIHPYE